MAEEMKKELENNKEVDKKNENENVPAPATASEEKKVGVFRKIGGKIKSGGGKVVEVGKKAGKKVWDHRGTICLAAGAIVATAAMVVADKKRSKPAEVEDEDPVEVEDDFEPEEEIEPETDDEDFEPEEDEEEA